jgi:hypothetical protein
MAVTTQQFTDNPRSKELRSISLNLIEKLIDRAKGNPDPRLDTDITVLTHQLDAMGITANMHKGKPQEAFDDPVVLAEYVAGQLYVSADTRDLIVMHFIRNVTLRFLDAE